MTREEFKEYAQEHCGCKVEGPIIKNVINGRFTRLDDSFDETSDLSCVHHFCVLGIEPTDDLEDLYYVYSPLYWKMVHEENE